jgi:hypothetical protein
MKEGERLGTAWEKITERLGCIVRLGMRLLLSCRAIRAVSVAILHGTIWIVSYVDKWLVVFLFEATEEWFKKQAPNQLKTFFLFSEIENGGFEKWKSKILKTEIPRQKIRKLSDLPLAPDQLQTFFAFSAIEKGVLE